jgi:flagellar hook-length control protein FliK
MTDEIKLLSAAPPRNPRRAAGEAAPGSRFGDTLGQALESGSRPREARALGPLSRTDAPPAGPDRSDARSDACATPSTPKPPGHANGSASPRGHRLAGRGAQGPMAQDTPAEPSNATAQPSAESTTAATRAGVLAAPADPGTAALPQPPALAPPQAPSITTAAAPTDAGTSAAASRAPQSTLRGPADAAQAARAGSVSGMDAAALQATGPASAAGAGGASSAGLGAGRIAEPDAAPGAGQAATALQLQNANARVDWQPAAARAARGGEAAGIDSAEPGRAAARLLETLRASRVAAAGDGGGPDGAGATSFAAALAAASPGAPGIAPASAPDAAPPAQLANPWPVDDPAFAQQLAAQVQESLLEGIERAEIAVTPPSMGPIRIELSLSGEQASVAFSAALPETCRAIEQSLPMLETMLSEHGLVLAEASVGAGNQGPAPEHGRSGGQPGGEPGAERRGGAGRALPGDQASGTPAAIGTTSGRPSVPRGLLDLFA